MGDVPVCPPGMRPRQGANSPAWANPAFSLAGYQLYFHIEPTGSFGALKCAKINPKRIAIGFATSQLSGQNFKVAPHSDPNYGWNVSQFVNESWFTIFEHGVMVTYEWFVGTNAGQLFGVYEILQQG